MLKFIFCALLLHMAIACFCQQTNPSQPLTREDYRKKSRSQKTGAFILLGAGVTTLAVISKGNTSFDVLPVLAVAGTLSTLGSIPLFIASGKNKRKAQAASVYFKMERAPVLQKAGINAQSYPSVVVRIHL